ncbi:MAG TPA: hypothetical protein VNO70_27210 [Blastocatellia bacterium]|nr:hypothetical protein [Blastocatellia bacterium]
MNSQTTQSRTVNAADEAAIRAIPQQMIDARQDIGDEATSPHHSVVTLAYSPS